MLQYMFGFCLSPHTEMVNSRAERGLDSCSLPAPTAALDVRSTQKIFTVCFDSLVQVFNARPLVLTREERDRQWSFCCGDLAEGLGYFYALN